MLSFHSGPNWSEPVFKACNRFLSVHALGFAFYNILHEMHELGHQRDVRASASPKLPVIWIRSGLAWVPFLMRRLDHEYMMRPSEAPVLKKKPSDYMRDMYYSSQPMEIQDRDALECTFRMINAETQLLYSSGLSIRTGTSTCRRPSTTCRSSPRRASTTFSAARRRAYSSSSRATTPRRRI